MIDWAIEASTSLCRKGVHTRYSLVHIDFLQFIKIKFELHRRDLTSTTSQIRFLSRLFVFNSPSYSLPLFLLQERREFLLFDPSLNRLHGFNSFLRLNRLFCRLINYLMLLLDGSYWVISKLVEYLYFCFLHHRFYRVELPFFSLLFSLFQGSIVFFEFESERQVFVQEVVNSEFEVLELEESYLRHY